MIHYKPNVTDVRTEVAHVNPKKFYAKYLIINIFVDGGYCIFENDTVPFLSASEVKTWLQYHTIPIQFTSLYAVNTFMCCGGLCK